jgi:hypothetical protein
VQQHKMTISFADWFATRCRSSVTVLFLLQEAKYANSTQLMLAMPNAAGGRPLGICSAAARALLAPPLCPQCGLPAAAAAALRPLPAKTAAVAAAGGGQ